jgi:hypothetical protein
MKYCFIVLLFAATTSYAQKQVLLQIPENGATITSFIPKGYDTLSVVTGDLNKDKTDDVAMVLFHKRENADGAANVDMDSLPPRLLILLFKDGSQYKLAGKSASAIMCKPCGGAFGDPFQVISIKRGILVINHYGGSNWRWSYNHKFRFQNNDWFLIGQTSFSYWCVEMCDKLNDFAGLKYEDINFITGQYKKKEISEDCKLLVSKNGKKTIAPLEQLSDFIIDN